MIEGTALAEKREELKRQLAAGDYKTLNNSKVMLKAGLLYRRV